MDTPVRLRRLEIQGFKSFASRTVFEFGPGITAIVGPNGSGKSNLADALRWALGEQSPRLMRLRRLEDAIFAGGGRRAQSGMAEVSLVLDNTDGWLPVEFGEVVVTRRLHRSGESEYLLNRRRARLRDILDLFLKARLGQNSYAILGQGMVDTVLSLRPEERRALIEEAADVRRHRLKIDEALDQLAATRDNRDRVELLIAEIAPRLAQLERQARRAAQHATLSRQLAEQLQRLYAGRVCDAGVARDAARHRYAAVAAQTERDEANLAAIEQRWAALEAKVDAGAEELRRLDEAWAALHGQERDAERRLQAMSERLPQLDARRLELSRDLVSLEEEAKDLDGDRPSGASPQLAIDQAAQSLKGAEARAQQAHDEAQRARGEFEAAEAVVREARARRARAQEREARVREQLDRLQAEQARLDGRARAALQKARTWAREFRQSLQRLQEQETRARAAGGALADARRLAETAEQRRLAALSAARDVETGLDEMRRRLELLTSHQEARRPVEEVVEALLGAMRGEGQDRPHVLGILGGLIHVREGYEVAVEAALADALNALIVRTEPEALAAVRALKEIEAGRLTFYVLDAVQNSHALNLIGEAGVLGVASDFVQCAPECRALIDRLLGRTIVAGDLEAARRSARRGLGAAVTLDGTVLRPDGAVSGGRAKSDGAVFRLAGELRALQERLPAQQEALARARAGVDRAQETATATAERARAAAGAFAEADRARQAAERAHAESLRRFAALRGELEWVRSSRAEFAPRRVALEAEAANAAAALPAVGAQAEADARLEAAREALAASQRDEARAAGALAEARGRLGALLAERASIEALQRSRAEARGRIARSVAARRQALDALELEQAETAALSGRLEVERLQRADAATGARRALEVARQGDGARRAEQHALREHLAAARSAAADAERARLDAELALARADEAVDRLAEEMLAEGISVDLHSPTDEGAGLGPGETTRELETRVRSLRRQIRDLGAVNEEAETDYQESRDRHDFLTTQVADLEGAEAALLQAIEQLRAVVREQFRTTFENVNADFQLYFRLFFGGGQARLALAEPEDYGESGVEIVAQPPGKRLQNLALLSGGERSMTAVALLFALLESNPAPFCVLDEVDAALDEANVGRFSDALARLARRSQFLVVTHNRGTVQAADQIYGVSMSGDGVSTVLSMRLSEAAPLLT